MFVYNERANPVFVLFVIEGVKIINAYIIKNM
jgi:hypothetical protein